MLIEIILYPLRVLMDIAVNFLPSDTLEVFINSEFMKLLAFGVRLIGPDNFMLFLGSITFWLAIQYGWAILEWIYKKIPGVS